VNDLGARAAEVLAAADTTAKVDLTRRLAADWRAGRVAPPAVSAPIPLRPGRPARPVLVPPRDLPKRKIGAAADGRAALLHALAHIELNAIDLGWDMVARFGGPPLPRAFADDWVTVAADEAEHFTLLCDRLGALDRAYGDLPAHDGLWQAAERTAHDLLARLAVVPMLLEARGLDVTPAMIGRLERAGDADSAAVLSRIYRDEIGHVAAGVRWFRHECAARGLDQAAAWRDLVARHGRGALKPPFNAPARERAGMPREFYLGRATV
jgi:uncharacterized ferritin-like protein (DUF455 family)